MTLTTKMRINKDNKNIDVQVLRKREKRIWKREML
jgi:hypothetical protein